MNGIQPAQFETLNAISEVAAMKATDALSKLLDYPIELELVPVTAKQLSEIKSSIQKDEMVVALISRLLGGLSGTCFLIYPEKSALTICDIMFHKREGATQQFGEREIAALTELANIVVGNFLTSFSAPLQVNPLLHHAAKFNHNKYSTFIDNIMSSLSKGVKESAIIEISFQFQHMKIKGMAIFLFDEEKMKTAMNELAV